MDIELLPLAYLDRTIAQQTLLSGTPRGNRLIGEAATCRWDGERVHASQHAASASDWVRIHDDGSVDVDARILLRTDDGAMRRTEARLAGHRPKAASSSPPPPSRPTTRVTPGSTRYRP